MILYLDIHKIPINDDVCFVYSMNYCNFKSKELYHENIFFLV